MPITIKSLSLWMVDAPYQYHIDLRRSYSSSLSGSNLVFPLLFLAVTATLK